MSQVQIIINGDKCTMCVLKFILQRQKKNTSFHCPTMQEQQKSPWHDFLYTLVVILQYLTSFLTIHTETLLWELLFNQR